MAIYIAAALLIRPVDNIVVSDPSYFMADHTPKKYEYGGYYGHHYYQCLEQDCHLHAYAASAGLRK